MMPSDVNLGLGTAIVNVLRAYGRISVSLLIDLVQNEPQQVEEYLELLAQKGTVVRHGDAVELAPARSQKQEA